MQIITKKSIGSLKGEVGFLSPHYLYTILGLKNWFPSIEIKRMIAKTSSHHSSSQPWTKCHIRSLKIVNHLFQAVLMSKCYSSVKFC